MTILSVAYPLAPVRQDTAGGAEQVLAMLDRALVRAGHRSVVVACESSETAGTLAPTPRVRGELSDKAQWLAQARHAAAVRAAIARYRPDVVHMHGHDWQTYLPKTRIPVVVTLHVPREWYGRDAEYAPPGVSFVCVSDTQRRTWPEGFPVRAVIPNGIETDAYVPRARKRGFVFSLGRVSPEKGTHLALDAAEKAGTPIMVAGEVYPYPAHEHYFWKEVLPRLNGSTRRFIGPVGLARKRRLLAAARCVLIPSQVPETSSLVAMEAMAAGTPVVAFAAGALAEIVEHGRTGFLVDDVAGMAEAIRRAGEISPEECRRTAERRFSAAETVSRYFELYRELAEGHVRAGRGAA